MRRVQLLQHANVASPGNFSLLQPEYSARAARSAARSAARAERAAQRRAAQKIREEHPRLKRAIFVCVILVQSSKTLTNGVEMAPRRGLAAWRSVRTSSALEGRRRQNREKSTKMDTGAQNCLRLRRAGGGLAPLNQDEPHNLVCSGVA